MIGEIKEHTAIEKLIDNPLMLTAICILYHDGKELPAQRAELYKKFIDNLLYRRFPDPEKIHDFLKTLAFEMQKENLKGVDKVFAVDLLKSCFVKKAEEDEKSYKNRMEKLFDEIEPKCGLLRYENGQYISWHLTFQEFLTANYIVDNNTDYGAAINEYWDMERYKEVIELYIGYLSMENKKWANKVVKDVIETSDKSHLKKWMLASKSMIDIHKDRREEDVLIRIRNRMLEIIDDKEEPKTLVEAGEILGWLRDPRDLKEFIPVKGGEYKLQDGIVKIKSFEIARYPVTNNWFEEFIKSDGYKNKDYWTDEGKKWLDYTKSEQPRLWDDRKWKCPNSPVVGISWYEAYAFTKWLTLEKNDGYKYRLLNENEWEATAAGHKGRQYPWGNKWDKNRCNNDETKLNKTSPVGIFLKGNTPEGISDLSGNAWEWTSSGYHSKKLLKDFMFDVELMELWDKDFSTYLSKLDEKDRKLPVLRGGSWNVSSNDCRCAFRYRLFPMYRFIIIGFRCARA